MVNRGSIIVQCWILMYIECSMNKPVYYIKIGILCILAAITNFSLNMFLWPFLGLSLYLDTLFTAMMAFSAGLLPGIITAVLTTGIIQAFVFSRNLNITWLFVFCSIAEVILICLIKPHLVLNNSEVFIAFKKSSFRMSNDRLESNFINFIRNLAILLLLSLLACVSASFTGGIIDYICYSVMAQKKDVFSPEDIFKMGFIRGDVPIVFANILSRLPINIVDRLIVVFGGYGLSRFIKLILRKDELQQRNKQSN